VLDLSRSVRALAAFLEDEEGPQEARRWALEAARTATEILEERHELGISVLVGQVRSAAVDLLTAVFISTEPRPGSRNDRTIRPRQ
jgi:hypothetical protein